MKSILKYKGYLGSINFDEKSVVFYGKIECIRALVTFEASEAKQLQKAFKQAVDDYLLMCREASIEPEKPFKGSLNVRLTKALHRDIARLAVQEDISINAYIKQALEQYVNAKDDDLRAILKTAGGCAKASPVKHI